MLRHLLARQKTYFLRLACPSSTSSFPAAAAASTARAAASTTATAATTSQELLVGRCSCGACGFEASGESASNFITHSSAPRKASGEPFLAAAGFKPDQVRWLGGESLVDTPPEGSQNPHYSCGECGSYLGVDASRWLGVVALNLRHAETLPGPTTAEDLVASGFAGIADRYRPNHHAFYADRVADVPDELPKWATVVQGDRLDSAGAAWPARAAPPDGRATSAAAAATADTRPSVRDVSPLSPTRPPEPSVYNFTEVDPPANHRTVVTPDAVRARVRRKYDASPGPTPSIAAGRKRDVIVLGGGHNALTAAAYLAKHGLDVTLVERRHILGGAAVTEEIVPGFKFSRASYLAGLMRPSVISELGLEKHGFEYLPRDPSSFTPTHVDGPHGGKYLMLGSDEAANWRSIAQWSERDADAYPQYEAYLGEIREIMQPLLDGPPPDPTQGRMREKWRTAQQMQQLVRAGIKHGDALVPMYELVTGPASHILDRWFDGEVLKTTLATDAVIGALVSPKQAGSAYVLLHHVMGESAAGKGVWSYMRGGMGTISESIAAVAREHGAELLTNATVRRMLYEPTATTTTTIDHGDQQQQQQQHRVTGVELEDGTALFADVVLSGASPYHTFTELMPYPGSVPASGHGGGGGDDTSPLPAEFAQHIRFQDFSCGALKINCALSELPDYLCCPLDKTDLDANGHQRPGPQHFGTVHFESAMEELEVASREASMGVPATRPVVEMTVPSAVDNTLAPPGQHVAQLFVQYAPYDLDPKVGNWADPAFKEAFAHRVFSVIDEFCPNFSSSIIGADILSPLDLERIFGLHKGNIFHGSMSLHQLGYARPMAGYSSHRTPMQGLYICGSGAHPGGGVMGAPGRNCANVVLSDLGIA